MYGKVTRLNALEDFSGIWFGIETALQQRPAFRIESRQILMGVVTILILTHVNIKFRGRALIRSTLTRISAPDTDGFQVADTAEIHNRPRPRRIGGRKPV